MKRVFSPITDFMESEGFLLLFSYLQLKLEALIKALETLAKVF